MRPNCSETVTDVQKPKKHQSSLELGRWFYLFFLLKSNCVLFTFIFKAILNPMCLLSRPKVWWRWRNVFLTCSHVHWWRPHVFLFFLAERLKPLRSRSASYFQQKWVKESKWKWKSGPGAHVRAQTCFHAYGLDVDFDRCVMIIHCNPAGMVQPQPDGPMQWDMSGEDSGGALRVPPELAGHEVVSRLLCDNQQLRGIAPTASLTQLLTRILHLTLFTLSFLFNFSSMTGTYFFFF